MLRKAIVSQCDFIHTIGGLELNNQPILTSRAVWKKNKQNFYETLLFPVREASFRGRIKS
jgi:hypothetical protein